MEKYLAPIPIELQLSNDFLNKLAVIEALGGYIAGGCARGISGISDEFSPVSRYDDIDFFLDDHAKYQEIFNLFSEWFQFTETTEYNNQDVDNFITIDRRIQLVKTEYMPPWEQVANFDLTVCKAYIHQNNVYMTQQCWEDCISLNLHYTKYKTIDNYQELSYIIHRLIKYLSKGFFLEAKECMRIIHCIKGDELKIRFARSLDTVRSQVRDYPKVEKIIRLYNL